MRPIPHKAIRKAILYVSVPLPGFSGLRLDYDAGNQIASFSRFSPVAGIQWVETLLLSLLVIPGLLLFQSRCRDSVG